MENNQPGLEEPIDEHHTISIVDWCEYCHDTLFIVEKRRAPINPEADTPVHDCALNFSNSHTQRGGTGQ